MMDSIMNQAPKMAESERSRLSVELSPIVMSHLDHISEVTGQSKAALVVSALIDALPELLARADGLKKRHQELSQAKKGR
jgi:predicted transcriptional regulator